MTAYENAGDVESKHILADKYKTRLCRNWISTQNCPYESRCMFAHGEAELRTPEDNIAQGLVSEEAIKQHQRSLMQQRKLAAASQYRYNGYPYQYSHAPYYPAYEPHSCAYCGQEPSCNHTYENHGHYESHYDYQAPAPSSYYGHDGDYQCNCDACAAANYYPPTEEAVVGAP